LIHVKILPARMEEAVKAKMMNLVVNVKKDLQERLVN
jgi:hypothetical protein